MYDMETSIIVQLCIQLSLLSYGQLDGDNV